jgi:hypothetical protein
VLDGVRRLDDYRKPEWWKRSIRSYWLVFVLLPFVIILIVLGALFLQGVTTLTELLGYAVVTSAFITVAYYIRKTSSLTVWRTVWILFGVGVIGFPVSVASAILLVNTLGSVIGFFPPFLLSLGIAVLAGAFLGDRLGKRRGYQPLG